MKNLTTTVLKNSWFKIFFILIICLFFVTTGLPANWADEFKITASDGDPTDFFGCSVSIDGDYAIIGSASDNVTGLNSGSAYIFHRNGTTWTEQQKLTASDSDGNDNFGYSVSIDGDYAIIGARYDEENGEDAGSAYIFHRTGSTWTEQQKLTAADGGVDDHFGISVCIDSDYAIIGAREMPEPSTTSGSAYIFHRSGTTWTEQQKLTASDGGDGELFGVSVYIDGEYAIIGAQQDDDNGSASGSAYIFHRSGTTWTEQQKLTAADGASGDKFGTSVCIDGEYAIIGAELDDDNGTDTGSAYIFDRSGTTWTEQQKLTAADGGVDDYFGTSVYINDDFVYIGAEGSGSDTGSTHIYHRSGTTWSEQQKLTAADGAGGDHFGNSVCFGDKYAIIGAQRDDDNGSASGSAYLYRAVNYWDGSVSDVWQNDNNWTLKHVPTLDEDVVITSDGFHPPYISSSTAYCRDIEFESGASLNQNGGYFRIFGDFNSDDGTFTQSSSGYLYFDGDSDTSWDDNNEDDTYYNVRVDKNISTAGVNMWQDMTVNTSFEIREGVFGINEEWTLNITGIGEPALQVEDGGKLRLNDEEIIVAGGIEFEDGSQLETGTNSVIRCGRNFRVEANTAYDIVFGQNSWLYMNGSSDQYIQDLDGGNLELAGLYITNNTGCVYIANEDLFIEGALNLDGNFSCKSSPSSSTVHDIYISSGWFEHDYADFEESTGRVIFNGGYLSRCWDGEFYELEIAKDSGQVFYVSDGGIIECDYLDWTSGSIEVEDGTFTANDLMDNGIYGNYILHPDGIINLHQDSGSYIDFNGSLNISGGIMNVYGGGYTSYWPYLTDATIEMSDGILDFHDHGIDIRNSGSNTLTENITGGTIRTAFGFEGDRSDFNPTGGTIELYGSTDAEINIGEGSNFFHVEINKNTKRDKKNELTTKKDREGNLIKTSKSNTITATSNLDINGSFIINSGIFAAPDTMWVAGDWVNNLDETAFQEGEGRVILDGSISWCYSEIFNDLEIHKDDTYLFIPVSNVVSCSSFTFETGKLQVDGGIFTADDLSQNGIFGWYELDNEGEINLYQDDSYLIDLNGNIYIDSGTMNVYGGVTTSFWPSSRDASIIMSGGTLDFHDNGIFIRNSASYSFSEDISGGTIRTAGSFTGERSDFNPSGGTIELYGSDDVELSTGEGSNLYNLHIDKTAVKESLTDKKYSIKTDREGKTRKIKRANTVDALNNLDIDGNFTLNNGTFTAPDTMWVAGNWTNNVGDAAFAEGTGRVIFDGDAVQYCSSEIFNDLELNKSFGYLRSNSGANITCENYDWTAGGLLITGTSSSFLANDLEDSGLYGTLEVHDDCTIDLHQDTGQFIDLNGYLKIYGGTMNVYGGASPSWWTADDNASITMSGGTLDFHDNGIHIYNSGNDLTEDITGGIIRTAHSFTGNRSDFNPVGGIIELYGSADATISMGDGSSFYNVNIDKAAKTNPKDSNTKEYVIVNNRDGTKTRYARANTINANSNLDITGDFTLETGSFTIGANSMNVTDSVNVYGTFTMGSSDASLSCENMNWFSGSVAEISDGTISVSGHWLFEDDIEAQFTTANTVNFTGDGNQFIYYRDDDSEFGNINCNQTSGSVWLHSSSTDTMRVAGDMTMLERSFHIQSEDLLVEGILDIQTGTDIDLAGSGSLTNNSPFTLNGELDVNLGDVYINGDFEMAVTGILQIDGGSFNVNDSVHGFNEIAGTVNMSDGLYFSNRGPRFLSTATTSVSGGEFDVDYFFVNDDATFEPTGGTVEISKNNDYYGCIHCAGSNYLYDLKISGTNSLCGGYLHDNLLIQNNLEIESGQLSLSEEKATVLNDVIISGGLKMINAADTLIAGNEAGDAIIWNASSYAEDTENGVINVYGDWTFADGTEAQIKSGSTVNFVGASNQFIYCMDDDAEFSTVNFNQSGGNVWLHSTTTDTMRVTGDMNIMTQGFAVQNNDLYVDGTLDVQNGAAMYIGSSGSLVNNSDFTLNGELDVGAGDAFIHGLYELAATGVLTIDGGNFVCDAPYSKATISLYGTMNLSDGLFEITNNHLSIKSSFTENITGGTIRCGGSFFANNANTFQPSNSTFETTTTGSGRYIEINSTNYFNNFTVNNTEPYAFYSPIWITDDVVINSGTISLNDATEGDLFVGGDWTNNVGPEGLIENTRTVTFYGSETSNINTDESFYDLTINKTGSKGDMLNIAAGDTIAVENEINVDDGSLVVNDNSALNIGSALKVNNGGGLDITCTSGNEALVTHYDSEYYDLDVNSGGNIAAEYCIFEYTDLNGVYIYDGGLVDTTYSFNHCTFRNGSTVGGTAYLVINNNQELTITGAYFPDALTADYNVAKETDQGSVEMDLATGDFAGEDHEWDPYERITWIPLVLPPVDDLTITYNTGTNDIELNWTYTSSADSFFIYRDTDPYFTPTTPYATVDGSTTTWSEPASTTKYFYIVTAYRDDTPTTTAKTKRVTGRPGNYEGRK